MKKFIILVVCIILCCCGCKTTNTEIVNSQPTETIQESTAPSLDSYLQNIKYDDDLQTKSEILIALGEINNYLETLYKLETQEVIIVDEIARMLNIKEKYEAQFKKLLEEERYTLYNVPLDKLPQYKGFKAFMYHTTITSKSSLQYKLQKEYAYTGKYGIRMIDGRYCIAVGSYFTTKKGQYLDIILANGTVIPCILADCKANAHTDPLNIMSMGPKCISEFVVDASVFLKECPTAAAMGDMSYCCPEWRSPVVQVKVYNKNIFDK
jgi:hypothetical protein